MRGRREAVELQFFSRTASIAIPLPVAMKQLFGPSWRRELNESACSSDTFVMKSDILRTGLKDSMTNRRKVVTSIGSKRVFPGQGRCLPDRRQVAAKGNRTAMILPTSVAELVGSALIRRLYQCAGSSAVTYPRRMGSGRRLLKFHFARSSVCIGNNGDTPPFLVVSGNDGKACAGGMLSKG